jgi:adenosylcobinamide kinase / adenosylcobinamide-phosphate guanylyltransferase
MARLILVTGGSRSGKSDYAQRAAEALPGPRYFVATCPRIDEEMNRRIEKHQEARSNGLWQTIEEPIEPARALLTNDESAVYLIDCITLWVNNLVYHEDLAGRTLSEEEMTRKCRELIVAAKGASGTIFLVTNEVGSGIVPDNPSARHYRDLVGRCNQVLAAGADEVFLVVCGLPMKLK